MFQKSRLPAAAPKRRKPNHVPPNSLAVGIVEEEESNLDDEMDEDTIVMNGEDVIMKDATNIKSETIHVIPNDAPVQLGENNAFIASWSEKAILATGCVLSHEYLITLFRHDGMVRMWTIRPPGPTRVDEQHMSLPTNTSGDVTCLCWHVCSDIDCAEQTKPNDSLLAAGTVTGLTTIWNIDGSLRSSLPSPHGPIFNLKFNLSGSLLVICSAGGVFEIYDTREWTSIFKAPASEKVWESQPNIPCLAWLDDSSLAILGPTSPNSVVNCWRFHESHAAFLYLQLIGHDRLINDIQYDKISGYIATASDDQSVRLWRTDKSTPYHEFRNHNASVRIVTFQPQIDTDTPSRVLASASFDGTVSLYDVTNFCLLHSIGPQIHNFPNDRISSISWSPDGKILCTGDLEGTVGVWEVQKSRDVAPRPFAIWAPERIREDQQDPLANGTNGHKDNLDSPVHSIHWQTNGQSFAVCRENRRVYSSTAFNKLNFVIGCFD